MVSNNLHMKLCITLQKLWVPNYPNAIQQKF